MITHNWFEDYAKEEGIAKAISVVAKRIRFTNEFHKTVDDIEKHKHEIEKQFLLFFPELITFVSQHGPESTLK
jgi:acyl carrier protein phosphodiesterase